MASPLETFILVFSLDGDDAVVEGLQRITGEADAAGKSLDKTGKSLDKTGKKSKDAGKEIKVTATNFNQLAQQAVRAIAPVLALGVAVHQTLSFAKQGEEVLFLANSANVAADSFQRWATASQMFGGSAASAAGVLSNLNAQMQAMKFGQDSPIQQAAIRYGINMYGQNGLATPEEMLLNIAERFENLDVASQLDLGRMIGLDEATIRLLQTGVAGVRKELEMASKYTVFSAQDLENARRFERTWREIKLAINAVWAELARRLLPSLEWLTRNGIEFFNYLREHGDFIEGLFLGISAVLTAIAVKSVVAFAPVWLAVAAVAALSAGFALFYDDFKTWSDGGAAALGPLWQTLVNIGKWWQDLPDVVRQAVDGIINTLNPLKTLKNLFSAFRAGDASKTEIPQQPAFLESSLSKGKNILSLADNALLGAIGKGDISNFIQNSGGNKNVTISNNITVNGGPANRDTAREIGREMDMINQIASGMQ